MKSKQFYQAGYDHGLAARWCKEQALKTDLERRGISVTLPAIPPRREYRPRGTTPVCQTHRFGRKRCKPYNPHDEARIKANRAIQQGCLIRPLTCFQCGEEHYGSIEGHHIDYSQPLNVVWLCRPCHQGAHRILDSAPEGE